MEISLEEYHEWLVEIRGLNIASLEYAGTEQGKDLLHYIPDESATICPRPCWRGRNSNACWREGIDGIPEMEQTVLSLYYHEELTLREIAQVVNLHESRISQLKSQAILRLRATLAEQWPASRGAVTA